MDNRLFGVGLRQKHVEHMKKYRPRTVGWLEVISENYINSDSTRRKDIEDLRADYSFCMHGVSMSLGSTDGLNIQYMRALRDLQEWLQPDIVSDHICWTGINNINSHDLLPVIYTEESLVHMIKKIGQVQDYLGRQIALENPSTYLEFSNSPINEWDFIRHLVTESDCLLLLDVNNVYVNCYNHGYNARGYIDAMPMERVVQIHLAGHKNYGTHIIDTHSESVVDEVWELYRYASGMMSPCKTMIEWDSDIPDFDILEAELLKARDAACFIEKDVITSEDVCVLESDASDTLKYAYNALQSYILDPRGFIDHPDDWVKHKKELSPVQQINIYSHAYRNRLFDNIADAYPATKIYLGEENFAILIRSYIERSPSKFYDMDDYIVDLSTFCKKIVDGVTEQLIKFEAVIYGYSSANKEPVVLDFLCDVNAVYGACVTGKLSELDMSDVSKRVTRVEVSNVDGEVFRRRVEFVEPLAI